jgi:hypothetical protein
MHDDDVNINGVLAFLVILAATLVIFYGIVTAMSRRLEKRAIQTDKQALSQRPISASEPYFPFPREQPDPLVDLAAVRARDEAELNSYGWINKTSGIVRIPIDRAIDLLALPPKGNP